MELMLKKCYVQISEEGLKTKTTASFTPKTVTKTDINSWATEFDSRRITMQNCFSMDPKKVM